MARKATISADALKGYLLEEVVAFLISNAGYRLLTKVEDDPHDLAVMSNGLQVRGRGGFHQADVLGEFSWAPAFSNPIRLFLEAKWRMDGRSKIGIPEARHAVGIMQDINQALVTIKPQVSALATTETSEDVLISGRGFCYAYRYALCSTSGFTAGAQAYALAHQVALLDLSHENYDEIKKAISRVGDELSQHIAVSGGLAQATATRGQTLKRIRAMLRDELRRDNVDLDMGIDGEKEVRRIFRPIINVAKDIEELFVGVTATGFVILLKADDPLLMIRHMRAETDPQTQINFDLRSDMSSEWRLTVTNTGLDNCNLFFALPDALLRALD